MGGNPLWVAARIAARIVLEPKPLNEGEDELLANMKRQHLADEYEKNLSQDSDRDRIPDAIDNHVPQMSWHDSYQTQSIWHDSESSGFQSDQTTFDDNDVSN